MAASPTDAQVDERVISLDGLNHDVLLIICAFVSAIREEGPEAGHRGTHGNGEEPRRISALKSLSMTMMHPKSRCSFDFPEGQDRCRMG